MTNHHSRFDRQRRLLARCRLFLRELNVQSDRLCHPVDGRGARPRSPEAQRHYDRAARLVRDVERELAR